jgi:photosystem II stability/assembly factor-like uncharacterized protein
MKKVILIYFFISSFCSIHATIVSKTYGTNNFSDVYFTDSLNGYIISSDTGVNYIMKTIDGGDNWVKITVSMQPYPFGNAIWFTSANVGYIVRDSMVLKTNDGGTTWTSHILTGSIQLTDICFVDADTGYIVGSKIYKTIDAGTTWTKNSDFNGKKIIFTSPSTGYTDFYKTTNYGMTWETYDRPRREMYIGFGSYVDFYFIKNSQIGFSSFWDPLGFDYSGSKTVDGGKSWFSSDVYSGKIVFTDTLNGFVVGSDNNINNGIKTTQDGGKTWNVTDEFIGEVNSIFFTDKYNGWFACENGEIIKYFDYTIHISSKTYGTNNFSDVYFTDSLNGYVISSDTGVNFIMKTTDGGENWVKKTVSIEPYPFGKALWFASTDVGYIVRDSTVLKTTDGGTSWTSQTIKGAKGFGDICFVDADTGYILGTNIYKTFDAGKSWQSWYNCGNIFYSQLFFTNPGTGFINFSRTTDYGKTWSGLNLSFWSYDTNENLERMFFVKDSKVGYMGWSGEVSNGAIYRTTDEGRSWKQTSFHCYYNNRIFFVDTLNGFVVDNSSIQITHDGGKSSENLELGYSNFINAVFFISPFVGWFVSYDGMITKYTNNIFFSLQPSDQYIWPDSVVTFQTIANGIGNIHYQWYKNEVAVQNATGNTLHIDGVQPSDTGNYYCIARNEKDIVKSKVVKLTIKTDKMHPPVIIEQPADLSVSKGFRAVFRVKVDSYYPVTFLWEKVYIRSYYPLIYLSETYSAIDSFVMDYTEYDYEGLYYCTISNKFGSVTTDTVQLTVINPQIKINYTSPTQYLCTCNDDSTVTFKVKATSDYPLSYQWYYGYTDSLVSGATDSILTLNKVTKKNSAIYLCRISNKLGMMNSAPMLMVFEDCSDPVIESSGNNIYVGDTLKLTVHAKCKRPLTYQWHYFNYSTGKLNDIIIPGITDSVFTISNIKTSDEGYYYCYVYESISEDSSGTKSLHIIVQPKVQIEYTKNDDIHVYPNPARNVLTIESKNDKISQIRMYNLQGILLFEQRLINDENKVNVELSDILIPGIYNLVILGDSFSISKIIIMQ